MNIALTYRRLTFAQVMLGMIGYAVADRSVWLGMLGLAGGMAAWLMVESPRGKPLPRLLINGVALAVAAWLVYTIVQGEALIVGLGRFILFMQLFKLFERKADRDWSQLMALSLMQLVCGSIISASFIYGLIMLAYLVIALLTVLLFQLKLGEQRACPRPSRGHQAMIAADAPRSDPPHGPRWRRHFAGFAVGCAAACLVPAIFLFLIMPRGNGVGVLTAWKASVQSPVTGFSDNVQLGPGSHIRTSPNAVMIVRLARNGQAFGSDQFSFHLRGMALDRYDATAGRWLRGNTVSSQDRRVEVDGGARSDLAHDAGRLDTMTQHITLRANTRGVLFAAPSPVRLRILDAARASFNPYDQVLMTNMARGVDVEYEVDSLIDPRIDLMDGYRAQWEATAPRPLGALRSGQPVVPEPPRGPVLNDPRLLQYTQRVLADAEVERDASAAPSPQDARVAAAIEAHLQQNFNYTLSLPPRRGADDPILTFLLDRREGHCEYFASAMAAMLRSLSIPARVITGYRVSEFNPIGGYYVVREMNAHAWVEAFVPEQGWLTFDPSPPADLASIHQGDAGILARGRQLFEYLEYFWISRVISYDQARREAFFYEIDAAIAGWMVRGRTISQAAGEWVAARREGVRTVVVAALASLGVIGAIIGFVAVEVRRRRRAARRLGLIHADATGQRRMIEHLRFYLQMLDMLEAAGRPKPRWQTPAAFARRLHDADPRRYEPVTELTELFYEIRYGGREPDEPMRLRAQAALDRLRNVAA